MRPTMSCPRCDAPLATEEHGQHTTSACPDCGGVWLGTDADKTVSAAMARWVRDAAQKAEQEALLPFRDEGAAPPATCPECGATCDRLAVGHAEIDRCAEHGAWYDYGEIERVALFLRAQEEERTFEAMREAMFKDRMERSIEEKRRARRSLFRYLV